MLPSKSLKAVLLALPLAAGTLFQSGCQTYTTQSADFASAWKAGQIQTATEEIGKKVSAHPDDKDTIIWQLEQGAVLRAAGLANIVPSVPPATVTGVGSEKVEDASGTPVRPNDAVLIDASNTAFEKAFARMQHYDEQARTSVAGETGAVLTNLANLPYRGKTYDRIMLHTYVTANYLKLGETDKARVELNRLLQSQRDAVAANAKRIADAQAEAEKAAQNGEKSYDASRAQSDPKVTSSINEMETELNANVRGYEDYVNPFSVFLDGLFFGVNNEGSSDMERSRKSFLRVAAMSPENPYAKEDLAIANELHLGKNFDNTTYVIFETGSAATLEQWRFDIPVFLLTGRISYVGAAFPRVKTDPNFTESLVVGADGATYPTALVSSMDSVIAQEFKNEWPAILTKTIISVGLKAVGDAAIQNQVKNQGWQAQLLAKAATFAMQAATNVADTRSWSTLPKQFQYARFPTPASGTITLQVGGASQEMKLQPGKVNLVWVKNVSPSAPVFVSQTVLKK